MPAGPTKSTSLRRSLAWRLLAAMTIALAVSVLGIALVARLINDTVATGQLDDASGHFKARIARIEENWLSQADAYRSQLVVSRILEEPNPRLRQARLTAFATAIGGEGTFTHVVLTDANGKIVNRYRTRSQQDLDLPRQPGRPGWIFGQRDQTLYRAISMEALLAGEPARLILYAPLDNALLGGNVYPNTAVRVVWNGNEVAESPRLPQQPPATAAALSAPLDVRREILWGDAADGPLIRIERRIVMPLTLVESLVLAAAALLAIGLLVWLILGRWLARQSRRIVALERGTAAFAAGGGFSDAVMRGIDQAVDGRSDEVAKLAQAAHGAMRDTLRQERQLQLDKQRFRDMAEMSSDWFWEQGADLRFVAMSEEIVASSGLSPQRTLGKFRWELPIVGVSEETWAAHRALLAQRLPFRDFEYQLVNDANAVRWFSVNGKPVFDAQGEFTGYRGTGSDITDRMLTAIRLRESEAELRLLMENVPASIGYFDSQLVLRYVNQGFEKVFGHPSGELVGRHLRETVSESAYREIEGHFMGALRGTPASYRRISRVPGQAPRTLDISVVPHRNHAGAIIGCYGVAIDVSAMQRAEEQVHSLQTLFTSTFQNTTDLMAIYRVEPEQLIIEGFNQALCRFYETRYSDVRISDWIGRSIEAFLREVAGITEAQIQARLTPFRRAVRDAEVMRYQSEMDTPTGKQYRDVLLVPITAPTGAVTHLFYRGADITSLAQKERELQALNADLERQVAARTADLSHANRELEAFAYAVSHDLRTPLRGIDGFSKLLVEEHGAMLGASGTSHLRRIRHGIQRMGDLIDDLLRLSRVTRGPLNRSQVDLSAMAAEIGTEMSRQAPARDVDWRIMPGVTVSADPGLMRLLLDNLLGNAFKYSRHVVHAVIEFDAAPVPGGIEIRVRDNGAGFDMAYAEKLFQPFQRLHGPKEFEGTGVGLATAFRIVARHGGTIEAHGETGKGAQFRIVLPLREEGA